MPDGYEVFSFEYAVVKTRHVILWKKEKGVVPFIDPQNNSVPVVGKTSAIEDRSTVVISRLGNAKLVELDLLTNAIQPFGAEEV